MASESTTGLEVWLQFQYSAVAGAAAGDRAHPELAAAGRAIWRSGLPALFAGLVPEGQLRQRIAQQCQTSESNDFGLLVVIDCSWGCKPLPSRA